MPAKDGFTALSELKNRDDTQEIAVIILSVKREADSLFEGQKQGALDYIIKPCESEELLSKDTGINFLKVYKSIFLSSSL